MIVGRKISRFSFFFSEKHGLYYYYCSDCTKQHTLTLSVVLAHSFERGPISMKDEDRERKIVEINRKIGYYF